MKRIGRVLGVVAIAALVLGGCSGDDDDAETTDEDTTTTVATDDTEASDATTTPSDVTEPSEGEADPMLELLRSISGDYSGTWTNTTFGSTGSLDLTLTVDEAAGTVSADLDLGGNVFGGSDPAEESLAISIDIGNLEAPVTTTSATFGDLTITAAADGSVTIEAPDVPGDRVATFSAQAQLTGTAFEGDYQVGFEDASPAANGTFSATKA
ncbi:MAG: hypothetical protein ACT4OX_10125 [Actinomycetota bacterium]